MVGKQVKRGSIGVYCFTNIRVKVDKDVNVVIVENQQKQL